jgi:hypothetical protein
MSPFGSHAMLQGLRSPSATVTTLNVSPAGPGGCADAAVEIIAEITSTAPAPMDVANFADAFMDSSSVLRNRAADLLVLPRTGVDAILARTFARERPRREPEEFSTFGAIDGPRPFGEA